MGHDSWRSVPHPIAHRSRRRIRITERTVVTLALVRVVAALVLLSRGQASRRTSFRRLHSVAPLRRRPP